MSASVNADVSASVGWGSASASERERVTPSASAVGCCLVVRSVWFGALKRQMRMWVVLLPALPDSWVGYPTLLYWVVGTGGQRCGGGGARGRRDRVWRQVLAVLLLVALLFGVGGFHGRRLDA